MKYFALFDDTGNRITSYVDDGMPYTEEDIKQIFPTAIEISNEDQGKYCTGRYIRDNATGLPINKPAYVPTVVEARTAKITVVNSIAAEAYVSGFASTASGSLMWYDSDRDTQTLIAGIYALTKESDWSTLIRYPEVAPAGQAPFRARSTQMAGNDTKVLVLLDGPQIKQLIDDLGTAFFTIKAKLWGLQSQVKTAKTAATVNKVNW